jgi:hypothetical protein
MTCSMIAVQRSPVSSVWTDLTGGIGRYCTMNKVFPVTENPCKVPAAGLINFSFWVETALEGSGTYGRVTNIYWFCNDDIRSDWDLGVLGGLWGGKRNSGDNGCPNSVSYHGSDEYAAPAGVVGTSGYSIIDAVNGHPYYKTAPHGRIDLQLCTPAAPLLIDSTAYVNNATFRSKSLISQVGIGPDGVQGDKGAKTFSWQYDEY